MVLNDEVKEVIAALEAEGFERVDTFKLKSEPVLNFEQAYPFRDREIKCSVWINAHGIVGWLEDPVFSNFGTKVHGLKFYPDGFVAFTIDGYNVESLEDRLTAIDILLEEYDR